MSPETHLLASWLIAAKTTNNSRDCRLVALAGILPDVDGLGLIVDLGTRALGHPTALYQHYHHLLLHGIFGGLLISLLLSGFARERWRVVGLAFVVFHLHLLCDLLGSRGPTLDDFWPIYYLGPFTKESVWIWEGQWRLDGWQNRYLSIALFVWALWLATKRGDSVVGVFNRRADKVFVEVLQKWRVTFQQSAVWKGLTHGRWRTVVPAVCLLGFVAGNYALWQPGLDVRDGEHDRRRNAIWIAHGWLGADEWFLRNGKTNQFGAYRDPGAIRKLATLLRRNHITDVFPHLCPVDPNGSLPALDDLQAERFLGEFSGFRVMPWIGGPNGSHVRYRNAAWREAFIGNVTQLLADHRRFAGVHLNIEPLPSGDADFLQFLTELHAALPKGKLLSVSAYPPPTRWHPYPDVHWNESYFRAVARRCDQLVVMMYDTELRVPKLYQSVMSDWTVQVLTWGEGKRVLLGVPTYNDAAVHFHDPRVENLQNALLGIHQGLSNYPFSRSYQGIALCCVREMEVAEWRYYGEHYLKH